MVEERKNEMNCLGSPRARANITARRTTHCSTDIVVAPRLHASAAQYLACLLQCNYLTDGHTLIEMRLMQLQLQWCTQRAQSPLGRVSVDVSTDSPILLQLHSPQASNHDPIMIQYGTHSAIY